MKKIWANSGDSHLMEPPDLFSRALPPEQAERMPRSVKDPDGTHETIYVDGREFRADLHLHRDVDALDPGSGPNGGRVPRHQRLGHRVPGVLAAVRVHRVWEPMWSALEEAGMVVGFHIGSDPHDASQFNGIYFRGPPAPSDGAELPAT
jgi:hypothetical protein